MRIDVLTLFPDLVTAYGETSVLGIAQKKGLFSLYTHNPRNYSLDRHGAVDDTPYGGGAGMLLMPQPFFDCLAAVLGTIQSSCDFDNQSILELHSQVLDNLGASESQALSTIADLSVTDLDRGVLEHSLHRDYEIVLTSPGGETWSQELAREFATKKNLVILCGRYEGFDERITRLATRKISLGDFVLTGGELPAMAIIDSVLRLLPGVLGDDVSSHFESFSAIDYLAELEKLGVTKRELADLLEETGLTREDLRKLKLLEYPQYTRPADFRGQVIPEILRSGNHKDIFLWRLKEAIRLSR